MTKISCFDEPRGGVYPGKWDGRFIWNHGESTPFHCFMMFRKEFELAETPIQSRVHVAVADKYVLYVNGEYIAKGPCRSAGPEWTCFDTLDLTGRLKPGKNVVAVLAYYYGCINNFSFNQRSGLFVQLENMQADGVVNVVSSDGTWKVKTASAWRRDVESICDHQGIHTEVYEAGRDPEDWMKMGFDDSAWEDAYVTVTDNCWGADASWSYLEPRITPLLCEKRVLAKKLVASGETLMASENTFSETQVPERLGAEEHHPLSVCVAEGVENLMADNGVKAVFHSSNGRDPFVIFDFGQPRMAIHEICFEATAGDVVEATYSDHLEGGRVPTQPPGNHMRYGDRYVARDGVQSWRPFDVKTATRYLQLVFRTGNAPLKVNSLHLVSFEYPVERRGSFSCSDDTLTRLWQATVETTYLHLEDTFVFDPVRERTGYSVAGEAEQQHLSYYAAFGDIAATDYNFRYTIRRQHACGAMPMFLGFSSSPGIPKGVLSLKSACLTVGSMTAYGVFYAQAVLNRHRYFAKSGFLKEQYPSLVLLTRWYERQRDHETGLLDNVYPLFFLDWPTHNKWNKHSPAIGANFGLNALFCKMLEDMAEIATALGHKEDSVCWRKEAESVRMKLRETHWNEERGLYVDAVYDGKPAEMYSELINAMAILYDIATPEQTTRILQKLISPDADMTLCSPLYFYYVIEGLIKAGADSKAMRYIAERYRPLMDCSDFPTIREQWVVEEVNSPGMESGIHGGGAGVAWTLTMHVLGIKPVAPGFSEVIFDPRPGDIQWAKGVLPTPHGDIRVEWHRDNAGKIIPKISLPANVKLVKIPRLMDKQK